MNQLTFEELLGEEKTENTLSPSPLHLFILKLTEEGVTSSLEICDILIKEGLISDKRYSSNKPKDYPKVCKILDEMVQQGKVEFIEDKDKTDRIYRLCKSK